jgi:iron(III) transport system permease protein
MGRIVRRYQDRIASGLAATVLLVLLGPPLFSLLIAAIQAPADVWNELHAPRLISLMGNSVSLATGTTVLSLLIGVPLAVLLGRTRLRFAALALLLHTVPLTLPPFLTALAAFHLFGRGGWFEASSSEWLFSMRGCILTLAISFSPVITVLTWLGVRSTDPTGDETARVIGGPWRTLVHVVLPQVAPSIGLGAIVVFSLVMVELAVPMFLRIDVYSAAVFARLGGFDFTPSEAAALTLPMLGISLLLWWMERAGPAHHVVTLAPSSSGAVTLLETPAARRSAACAGFLAACLGATPVIVMTGVAICGNGFSLLSTYLGNVLANSLLYATIVSTIVVALAFVLASVARDYPRFIHVQDALAWLGYLLPPALFAVAAVTVWNRSATQWIYASPAIVALALAARYSVLALGVALAGERQLSPSLCESARVCGSTYLQRLVRIQLPALKKFIAGAWLIVFVFCLRDVETSALLYPPGGEPLTVRMFTLEANGPVGVVAALAVVLAALTIVPFVAAFAILRR